MIFNASLKQKGRQFVHLLASVENFVGTNLCGLWNFQSSKRRSGVQKGTFEITKESFAVFENQILEQKFKKKLPQTQKNLNILPHAFYRSNLGLSI
jgi:hypothetical protein